MAISSGCAEIAKKLLDFNIDVARVDSNGDTPLHLAFERFDKDLEMCHEVVEIIVQKK